MNIKLLSMAMIALVGVGGCASTDTAFEDAWDSVSIGDSVTNIYSVIDPNDLLRLDMGFFWWRDEDGTGQGTFFELDPVAKWHKPLVGGPKYVLLFDKNGIVVSVSEGIYADPEPCCRRKTADSE
jgi:hypothetical protein